MNILDNLEEIKKLDKSNVLGSVQQLGLQLKQTKEELAELRVPKDYQEVNKVVISGMGGSRLGARVAERLFEDKLTVPIIPVGNYQLPKYVDEKTLFILVSYSGNTEEIVSSAKQALKKECKIMIFSQGGKLTQIARDNNLPGYYGFTPKYNPSDQPRMSIGYQILGTIILLSKCNLFSIADKKIDELQIFLDKVRAKYDVGVLGDDNLAKKTANTFKGKVPITIGAEFLVGALHVWRNQGNENAKHFGIYQEIPELNHHLMEGLKYPESNLNNLVFFFVKSKLYHLRNQQRIEITKKVLDKYGFKHMELELTGKTKLQQAFEIIQFGGFTAFYLSMLNGLDPAPIPFVDYFKKELKKLPDEESN